MCVFVYHLVVAGVESVCLVFVAPTFIEKTLQIRPASEEEANKRRKLRFRIIYEFGFKYLRSNCIRGQQTGIQNCFMCRSGAGEKRCIAGRSVGVGWAGFWGDCVIRKITGVPVITTTDYRVALVYVKNTETVGDVRVGS